MKEEIFARLRDWVEPAHPSVVKLYEDLIAIYTRIRKEYQKEIDLAFDRVSRQIGFVVTTTVPIVLEVGERGMVKSVNIGVEHLKGTLFDRELSAALKSLVGSEPHPSSWVSSGTYKIYLLWFEALSLKLRADWMEPAHFLKEKLMTGIRPELVTPIRPEVMEPAHWFDPGIAIAVEEAVLIEAIDQVYPELRLVDRVASYRQALRRPVRPEVMEPAHFGSCERPKNLEEILKRIRQMLDWV